MKINLIVGLALTTLLLVSALTPEAYALTQEEQASNKAELEKAKTKAHENANPPRPPDIEAYRIKMIAVNLSNSCLSLVKNNMTTKCPGYENLTKYDTTNPSYSGKFIVKNGHTYRDPKTVKNESVYLNTVDYIICVDCKHKKSLYKEIILVPSLPLYKKDTDKIIVNNTFTYYAKRSVTNCEKATIEFSTFLLLDTMEFLRSDCKNTAFDEKIIIQKPYTKHDISTSKAYQYQKWLQEMKTKCKTKC